ncbi:hypothetical protein [Mycobacteroides abscessus]|uniref:hypothetical protein n=1 Tax=Mycobacteroides abscessus TaxID=36809 RepID=UPI0012FFE701|nr:hypothetical protein [Mycobacteroides abscessus]
MAEYAEDLPGPELPALVEESLAEQRTWRRLLRGSGAVTAEESAEAFRWWLGP